MDTELSCMTKISEIPGACETLSVLCEYISAQGIAPEEGPFTDAGALFSLITESLFISYSCSSTGSTVVEFSCPDLHGRESGLRYSRGTSPLLDISIDRRGHGRLSVTLDTDISGIDRRIPLGFRIESVEKIS